MAQISTGARLLSDALIYRLRRREANNLAATISLLIAFGFPWWELLLRAAFAVGLNAYVYLMNDVFDIALDLGSASKDRGKVRFLAEHRSSALAALCVTGALLLGVALAHSVFLTAVFAVNAVLIVVYSGWLKRLPVVDVLAMVAWGATMTLVGVDPARALAWKLVGLLALLSGCYEVIQVIRDEPGDRDSGLLTTAVLLGPDRAAWLFRGLALASAVLGVSLIGSWIPAALAVAVVLPLSPQRAERSWDRARLLFGAVWLGLLVQVYLGHIR